jgi:hypothetical protein
MPDMQQIEAPVRKGNRPALAAIGRNEGDELLAADDFLSQDR